jgi:hypothetical protein
VSDHAARAAIRRAKFRAIASQILDEILAIRGDDARQHHVNLLATYLVATAESSADGAVARLTADLTDEERELVHRRLTEGSCS